MIAVAILVSALVQSPMTFTTIQKGPLSGIDAARQVVARTGAEWQALWREHDATRQAPPVDFSKSMVVGVFMGSRRTAGYAVEITRVEREDGAVVVFYRQSAPGPGAMTAQIITAPFHIILVEREPGTVRFQADTPRPR